MGILVRDTNNVGVVCMLDSAPQSRVIDPLFGKNVNSTHVGTEAPSFHGKLLLM